MNLWGKRPLKPADAAPARPAAIEPTVLPIFYYNDVSELQFLK
jgi:hypothetical protein